MKRQASRGVILGLVIVLIPLLFVLTMAMGTMGITQLSLQQVITAREAAAEAAQAGLARAVDELSEDNGWTAGLSNEVLSNDPDTRYSVSLVNNIGGSSNKSAGGVVVPPGFAYVTARGTARGRYTRKISSMVSLGPEFPYAIASGGTINIASVNSIAGPMKSSGSMIFGIAVLETEAKAALIAGGPILNVALVTLNDGAVLSRGYVALQLLFLGASSIKTNDTSDASAPFIQDGRIRNNPPDGREVLPNPDLTKLLEPGTFTSYPGFREYALLRGNGIFDLAGKVHYFPDGVRFGLGSILVGKGTIVVGNANKAEFTIAITNKELNVIALDGNDGKTGGAYISFTGLTSIKGLVYCHGKIDSLVGLNVEGKIIAYGSTGVFNHLGGLLLVTNGSMRHIAPGFSPWLAGGNDRPVVVRGWSL